MSNQKLSPEAAEAKRAYNREWRRTHPDKVMEYQNRYWEKVFEKTKNPEPDAGALMPSK